MSSSDYDTVPFDMTTYAYVAFKMDDQHLFCLWSITPLKEGVMLNLDRFDGEQERIFLNCPQALNDQLQSIIDWATAKSQLISVPPPK